MNKTTHDYRKAQLDRVLVTSSEYSGYSIKVVGPNDSTKYLSINRRELLKIYKAIVSGEDK